MSIIGTYATMLTPNGITQALHQFAQDCEKLDFAVFKSNLKIKLNRIRDETLQKESFLEAMNFLSEQTQYLFSSTKYNLNEEFELQDILHEFINGIYKELDRKMPKNERLSYAQIENLTQEYNANITTYITKFRAVNDIWRLKIEQDELRYRQKAIPILLPIWLNQSEHDKWFAPLQADADKKIKAALALIETYLKELAP